VTPLALLAALTVTAVAQSDDDGLPPELPPIELHRVPPDFSWEVGVHVSFGDITYWREEVPPWIGLGLRGGWGRHWGLTRIGAGLAFGVEGPAPVHYSAYLEPTATWDWTSSGLFLGLSAGPSFLVHGTSSTVRESTTLGIAPLAAVRLGWSQGWSRIGRRLFFLLEPKARIIAGRFNPSVALVIGTGRGY